VISYAWRAPFRSDDVNALHVESVRQARASAGRLADECATRLSQSRCAGPLEDAQEGQEGVTFLAVHEDRVLGAVG
jgi:hypothetical protein